MKTFKTFDGALRAAFRAGWEAHREEILLSGGPGAEAEFQRWREEYTGDPVEAGDEG